MSFFEKQPSAARLHSRHLTGIGAAITPMVVLPKIEFSGVSKAG
jgi:hypothetical protein